MNDNSLQSGKDDSNFMSLGFLNKIMSSIKRTFLSFTGTSIEEAKSSPLLDLNNQPENNQSQPPYPSIVPKITRSEYLQSKPKKVNPTIQITQYITNAKCNAESSNLLMQSNTQSAFRGIKDEPFVPILQSKQIINYNDVNKGRVKPKASLLHQKHQRSEEDNKEAMSLSFISNSKVNKSLIEQIVFNHKIRTNTVEKPLKSFEDIKAGVERKTKTNEAIFEQMNELAMNKKPRYDYEEKRRKIYEVYQAKRANARQMDIDYFIEDDNCNRTKKSHLSLGYGEKVIYKGKEKNCDYKMSSNVSLNFEHVPKPKPLPPIVSVQPVAEAKDKPIFDESKSPLSFWNSEPQAVSQEKEKEKAIEPKEKGLFDNQKDLGFFKFQPLSDQPNGQIFLCGESSKNKSEAVDNKPFSLTEKKAEPFPQKVDKSNKEKDVKADSTLVNDEKKEKEFLPLSIIPDKKSEIEPESITSPTKEPSSLFAPQKEKMKLFLKDEKTAPLFPITAEEPSNQLFEKIEEIKDNKPQDMSKSLFPSLDKDKFEAKPLFPSLDKDKDKLAAKPQVIDPKKGDIKTNLIAAQLKASIPANTDLPKAGEGLFNQDNPFTRHVFTHQTSMNQKDFTTNKTSISSSSIFDNKASSDPNGQKTLFPINTIESSGLFNQSIQKPMSSLTSLPPVQPQESNDSQMETSPVTSPKIQSQANPTQMPFQAWNKMNTLFPSTSFIGNPTPPSSSLFPNNFNTPSSANTQKQPTGSSLFSDSSSLGSNKPSTEVSYQNLFGNIQPTSIGTSSFPSTSNLNLKFTVGKK